MILLSSQCRMHHQLDPVGNFGGGDCPNKQMMSKQQLYCGYVDNQRRVDHISTVRLRLISNVFQPLTPHSSRSSAFPLLYSSHDLRLTSHCPKGTAPHPSLLTPHAPQPSPALTPSTKQRLPERSFLRPIFPASPSPPHLPRIIFPRLNPFFFSP